MASKYVATAGAYAPTDKADDQLSGPGQSAFSTSVGVGDVAWHFPHFEQIEAVRQHLQSNFHNSCRIHALAQQLETQKEAHLRVAYQHSLEVEQQEHRNTAQSYLDLVNENQRIYQELKHLEGLVKLQKTVIQQQEEYIKQVQQRDELIKECKSNNPALESATAAVYLSQEWVPNQALVDPATNHAADTESDGLSEPMKTDTESHAAEDEDVPRQDMDHAKRVELLPVDNLPDLEQSDLDFCLEPPVVPLPDPKDAAKTSDALARSITPPNRVQSSVIVPEEKRPAEGEIIRPKKRRDRRTRDVGAQAQMH